MSELAILVPVLGRPHRVKPFLDSVRASTPDAMTLFICSPGDEDEILEVEEAIRHHGEGAADYILCDGGYAPKINRGVRFTSAPLIFTAADDLDFKPGWLEAAKRTMASGAEVVGVNDMLRRRPRRREHATHFLMTRAYAELPCLDGSRGPCAEAYLHNFVDDELIATASHRGAYGYSPHAEVEHLHWMNRRAEVDATYEKGRESFEVDRRTFEERRHLWA